MPIGLGTGVFGLTRPPDIRTATFRRLAPAGTGAERLGARPTSQHVHDEQSERVTASPAAVAARASSMPSRRDAGDPPAGVNPSRAEEVPATAVPIASEVERRSWTCTGAATGVHPTRAQHSQSDEMIGPATASPRRRA